MEACLMDLYCDRNFAPWKIKDAGRIVASERSWKMPLSWTGRVVVTSDIFEDWQGPMVDSDGEELYNDGDGGFTEAQFGYGDIPAPWQSAITMQDVRSRLFDLIDATPNLDWLLLTKRPENIMKMWPGTSAPPQKLIDATYEGDKDAGRFAKYRPNVWLLTSVSDQQTADAMISPLLQCRNLSPVLGLSMEPMVGPVDVWSKLGPCVWSGRDQETTRGIDWVIVGGESGHGARPMHPQWAIDIRNQCQAAGVPFFFKQWGEWAPYSDVGAPFTEQEILGDKMAWVSLDGRWSTDKIKPSDFGEGTVLMSRVGKDAAGRKLDGRTWDEFPKARYA
jgi:protein gp37